MLKLLREEPEILAVCLIVLLFLFGRVARKPMLADAPPVVRVMRI